MNQRISDYRYRRLLCIATSGWIIALAGVLATIALVIAATREGQ